jgi:hypothetical protein
MWGALSDESTGVSFVRFSSSKSVSVCVIYILHIIRYIYIYNIYMQVHCQSRLSIVDHALTLENPDNGSLVT